MTMWIADTVASMRQHRACLTGTVALVPTMGALHNGHLSLIRTARQQADVVLVSIFVNPTQFGEGEDLGQYPRPVERDMQWCRDENVTGVFAPDVQSMYPPGAIATDIGVPQLADQLEGAHRPGHFAGVCRVVAKLFHICQPDLAYFGRKDYQQLCIIRALAADLNIPVRIVACDTVRDADGLALSSRNAYLSKSQRCRALGLSKALHQARRLVEEAGETDRQVVEAAMRQVMTVSGIEVDYAAVRLARTLTPPDCIEPALTGGVVALVAGRVDGIHLIDNERLGSPDGEKG